MTNKKTQKNTKSPDGTRIVLLLLTIFTWFIGALLYLLLVKPKGVELIICILAIFIPVIPGILLFLNAFGIINI
ncbi:MAG: hypothetical protein KFW07_03520 [Mycoplasmataceae bacterium]|nr:hypothetical protein [Mycoplasmataceae bacterium]